MKVFTGPANSGKTSKAIALVAEALTEGRRAKLVVPSANAATAFESRLAALLRGKPPAQVKQPLVTFPGLYTQVLSEAGATATIIHPVERERLIREVILDLAESGDLHYFYDIADRPGLAGAIASFIDELWRSVTGPEAFEQIARQGGAKDKDIAVIFSKYTFALDSIGAVDAEGAGFLALAHLKKRVAGCGSPWRGSTGAPPPINLSLVAVDGFDFYTPLQVAILELLSSWGVEVAVTLTIEPGRAVHLWHERTLERLIEAGAEIIESSAISDGPIERVAARLMNDEDGRQDEIIQEGDNAIKIVSAPDRAAEVRAAAREIKRLVSERGVSTDEIAIVCRSLATYAHHLDRIFRECAVPLAFDCAKPLAESPLAVSLMRLLGLAARSFSRRACVDCLRSPFFNLTEFGLDSSSVDRLDRTSIEQNVTRGRHQWLGALDEFSAPFDSSKRGLDGDTESETTERRRERSNALKASLGDFFDTVTPPPMATRAGYARWVSSLIGRLDVAGQVMNGDPRDEAGSALETLLTLVGIIASGKDDLTRPGQVRSQTEVRWHQFYDELDRAIKSASFERPANSGAAVTAQEIHHLRPVRYRAVFVLGLIEGEFPAKATESAPYTIREREQLRSSGLDLTELPTDVGADLTQFYKAISRSRERLYLSYARTDLAGGELLPSYLIEEVKAVAATEEARISQAFSDKPGVGEPAASLEELALRTARAMRSQIAGKPAFTTLDDSTRAAIDLLSKELPSWRATIRGVTVEQGRTNRSRSKFDGLVSSRDLLRELDRQYGPHHFWYASQINDYGVCPFRFFAKHVLGLAAAEEPGEGFAANQLGNAYHEILELLHRKLKQTGVQLSDETIAQAVEQAALIAEQVLERKRASGNIRAGNFWDFEKREITKRVTRLLQKEVEWNRERPARPTHFERGFGFGGEAPLVVQRGGAEVRICGVIDRIDETDAGSVVIDYKTGRTPISHRDALDGRNLQLPIYVMAAGRVVNRGSKVSSAYYLHINSRKKGSELPRKGIDLTLDEMVSRAEDRIVDYVSRARAGQFEVAPNGGRCFPRCEFEVACRVQSVGATASDDED